MRVIDLSYPIEEGMPTFAAPWHPVVEITILGRHAYEGRATRKLSLGTHTGTHVDAPLHFIKDGRSIESLSVDVLVGPARVVKFPNCPPGKRVEVDELAPILAGKNYTRVLFRYDWSRYWKTAQFYENWPHLSLAAAQFLLDEGVKLVGMDSPSPDNPGDNSRSGNDSPVHKLLMNRDVILVEYLTNLGEIAGDEVELAACPLNILGSDGAPARCVAIER